MKRTHFLNGNPLKTEEETRKRKKAYSKKYWETYKRKPPTPEQKERQRIYSKQWWQDKGYESRKQKRLLKKEAAQYLETVSYDV